MTPRKTKKNAHSLNCKSKPKYNIPKIAKQMEMNQIQVTCAIPFWEKQIDALQPHIDYCESVLKEAEKYQKPTLNELKNKFHPLTLKFYGESSINFCKPTKSDLIEIYKHFINVKKTLRKLLQVYCTSHVMQKSILIYNKYVNPLMRQTYEFDVTIYQDWVHCFIIIAKLLEKGEIILIKLIQKINNKNNNQINNNNEIIIENQNQNINSKTLQNSHINTNTNTNTITNNGENEGNIIINENEIEILELTINKNRKLFNSLLLTMSDILGEFIKRDIGSVW